MDVAILGCGYVGLELGRQLRERGHTAIGARRSEAGLDRIEQAGLPAIRADVTNERTLRHLPDVDTVVFIASSGGRGADAARRIYVEGLETVIDHFGGRDSPPDRLLYTSSTGVYGDHDGNWVDEETSIEPTTEKTAVLAEAEQIALERAAEYGIDGTIARFAGLYGPDRYRLDRYLDGPVTAGYLNMIHHEDAAGACRFLLTSDHAREEVVVVVDDEPVEKWAFADWLADQCGVPAPPKETTDERIARGDLSAAAERRIRTEKRCSNEKLRNLGYAYQYPTYREGYRAAIDRYRDTSNSNSN